MYDSDDERAYSKEKIPDPTSNEYFHDEIDDFHANKDKVFSQRAHLSLVQYQAYSYSQQWPFWYLNYLLFSLL